MLSLVCMGQESNMGKGMASWAKELEGASPELSRKLNRPREDGWRALEDFDLPRYKRIVVPVEKFLLNPAEVIKDIPSKTLFVFLQPKTGQPVRKTKLTLEEAVAFVKITTEDSPDEWEVHISETSEEKYGGNVYVKKDGHAVIEMTTKGQGAVSAGTVTPELRAWQDEFLGTWHFSSEDLELKRLVRRVMKHVPHEGRKFLKGLYEFHIIESDEDGSLEVKFVDFRDY